MSAASILTRSSVRAAAVASVVAGTVLLGLPVTAGAPQVVRTAAASSACPAAYPVSALHRGMAAYGLTTDQGTTPRRFTARVLGVMRDGVAPGIDMILIRASSPAIRAAGGIWSGMSGSPVYAADGRLIGAVSYGLAYGPSPTAGVTPAAAIYNVGNYGAAGSSYAEHVMLTPALQRQVTQAGASIAAASRGMMPLPTPVAVSGVGSRKLRPAWSPSLPNSPSMRLFPAAAAPGARASARTVRPGSPFAVAVSYGAFTYAGIGTATAVCGRHVYGWGHPMMAFGATSESAHAARIAYVQKETLGAPFVVGNIGGVVGTVTQDRLGGVGAWLGKPGHAARIHVAVSAGPGLHRTGVTRAPVTSWVPTALANAAYGELWSTLQMDGAGTAFLSWTVKGHRAHGKRWSYSRTDRTDSQWGIGYSVGDMLYYPLSTITDNPFERVTVDKVTVTVQASQGLREYTLSGLKMLRGKRYVAVAPDTTLQVDPGQVLALRATLLPYRGIGGKQTVELTVRVPKDALPGSSGQVTVMGGASSGSDGEEGVSSTATPTSLDDVLAQLRATPRNDHLYAEVDLPDALGNSVPVDKDKTSVKQVVRGTISVPLQVAGGEEPQPAG